MYSHTQRFWNKYNIAWLCRPEPSSDRITLTTQLYAVFGSSGIKLPIRTLHIWGRSDTNVFILKLGSRVGWAISFMAQLFHSRKKKTSLTPPNPPPLPVEWETGWASGSEWTLWRSNVSYLYWELNHGSLDVESVAEKLYSWTYPGS